MNREVLQEPHSTPNRICTIIGISIFAMAVFCLPATAQVVTSITETTDFSDNGLAPTAFSLDPGVNVVVGSVGLHQPGVLDRDYFSLTVPPGYVISSLVLGPGTQVGGAFSFIGVQAGPVMT